MKALFDFFPLILFFVVYKTVDIYAATAVAIVATFIQVGWFWARHRRFETMHLVTMAVITIFGGLTIYLKDDTFIKWKPTIVYWLFALILFGTHWLGKKTAIEHLVGKQVVLTPNAWKLMNMSWAIFFSVMGAINIYVAFFYGLEMTPERRTDIWVNFKTFGAIGLTFAFILIQAIWLARRMQQTKPDQHKDPA
jgi:intracellular septation protein